MINTAKFSREEVEKIFETASRVTGTCQEGKFRKGILLQNVARRMQETKISKVKDYLEFAQKNKREFRQLVSALTIHTTSWFRESSQIFRLREVIKLERKKSTPKKYRILVTACSTGKEAYTLAMLFESMRVQDPNLDYEIVAGDIDPVSVSIAAKGIYSSKDIASIPKEFHKFLKIGSGRTAGLMTFRKSIRERCKFSVIDLMKMDADSDFDIAFCRNVLIYFKKDDVTKIVTDLKMKLNRGGLLCLGSSEAVDPKAFNMERLGNAIYRREKSPNSTAESDKKILIVDDSKTIRRVLEKLFSENGYEAKTVESSKEADEALEKQSFDIISLDLRMPDEDGHVWLERARANGLRTPVVIVSDVSSAESSDLVGSLMSSAQEHVEKKLLNANPKKVLSKFNSILDSMAPTKAEGRVSLTSDNQKLENVDAILIGASTGGTEALTRLLSNLPAHCPPIVVVQHIRADFLALFAERLATESRLKLAPMTDGEELRTGHLYMALDPHHIAVESTKTGLHIRHDFDDKVHGHIPAVDKLFDAKGLGNAKVAAMLLTGMGKDGAEGMLSLKNQGSLTFAQDKESSVVFGMPRAAIELGAVGYIGNIDQLRFRLDQLIEMYHYQNMAA